MEQLPHPSAKHRLIEDYAVRYGLKTFVETGTGTGATVQAARSWADEIHSVEVFPVRYLDALFQFGAVRDNKKIKLYFGDSADVLRAILPGITWPALFWLDAHYDGLGSPMGAEQTPILKELELIVKFRIALSKFESRSIVLVDDAGLFGKVHCGTEPWPSIVEMEAIMGAPADVKDDIARWSV